MNDDLVRVKDELNRLREEIIQLPEDPFAVIPDKIESSNKQKKVFSLDLSSSFVSLPIHINKINHGL